MPYTDEQIEGIRSYSDDEQAALFRNMSQEEQSDLAQSIQAYNERKAGKQPDAIQGFVSSGVPVGHAASVATGAAPDNGPVVQQRQPELDRFMQATKIPYGLGGPTGVETSDPTLLRPEDWQNEVKNFTLSNGKVTNIRGDRAVWLDPSKGDATKHGWYWWTNHGWQQAPMRPYGKEPEIGELAKNLPQVAWQQSKDIGHAVAATAGEFRENPAEASRNAAITALNAAAEPARQALGAGMFGMAAGFDAAKQVGLELSDDQMDKLRTELDKRGMAKISSALGAYRELQNALLPTSTELMQARNPELSKEQQQQLKEVGETYAGKSGRMAGDLLPFLIPMGAAEQAGAKAASKLTSFGSRLTLRTAQGAVVSAPQAFKEYGEVKQNLMASGMDEEEATGEALWQSAKDYSVSAPAMGLLFSSRFGKVFLPTSAAKAGLNRMIRAGGVTTGQVAIGNIVNGRPVADNFMESFAQNVGWEMAHLSSDIKAGKRIPELQKEYPSLEAAKLAKQQEFAIYNADFLSHPTKESKANYDKVVTDLGILHSWGDRLKFEGKEQPNTEAEGAKTGSSIKTVARRTAKISETPTNTPEQPTQPTDAIAPQETAIAEQAKPTEVPNAIQEQGAGEMGAQPRGTEGVGEQAGGVRPSEQWVEPARAQVGPEVAKPEVLAQGEEGKVANHPDSSSVQKGEAGFISKEMLGMDPELYKAIYGIAIKKMGLPEGATPADIANHVMGKIKTLGNNVAETTAKILTQIKGITRDAASRLAQILHDNFSVQGERNNITLEEGGKNGAERGRPGNLEVSGREKPTEDRPAEISESQEGRVARQTRLDATDAGSPTLLGPNLSLIEHHSIERRAVKTPRLGYDAVFFHSPDGSIAVVADRDGKRAYVTGNVESNGDITIGELEGNKVKGVGTDLIQTLVREANGRFPETRGKETKGYAEGSTEEGPEGIHRMFNRFKSTLWSEDHKVSVLSDDIADSQFKHVESVKPEDVKSQIRDFYAGDTNKYNRSDLYKNSDIWTSKTPEEVNDFLLKHSEAKLDVKDPQFLADTFGGQQVYERIIKKMGLPEDASMRQIGEFTMGKIKSLGNTVAETTNKILTRVAGIGREAASKLAEFLHSEWENFKKRNGEQGAVTFGDLKRNAKKLASKQLSEDVVAKIDPADRDKAENMARMGIYAGEGSKYWDAMDEPQRNALKKAEDTFISQTQKAIKDFDPVKRFGRVRKASAEYDRSRAVAKATQEYIDLRNDTLVELERRGDIKLDPVEKFNIHATQQLSQGLFTDVSKASLKAQRDYAMTLHRELARKSQGLDTATKHAAIDVLNESKKVDPIVAEEAYRFVDAVDAGLQADYQKLSKGARDYIDKFIKPLQQINNGLYQNGQDMIGGDKVKDITHMPHKFEGVVDEDGNLQPPSRGMQLYKMRGIKPGSSNEIARTVEAGTDPSGKRYILNLQGDERASVWKNGDRIATASKGKDAEGHDVWKFKDKGATGRTIELKSGRATVDEIEHHTPFRYSHDPVVSLVDSVVGLSEASRAKAMIDALVTSNMIRPNYDAPKGWAKVELSNVQGMMAPPDIASVLNDYHRSLNRSVDNSEIARATKQLGRAFINLGFVNPLVHMPNVIAHGVTGRGVSPWFTPSGAKALLGGIETGLETMGDTATNRLIRKAHDRLMGAIGSNVDPFRDNTFRNLSGLSGRMMNLDPKRTLSLKLYNKMMGEAIESNPEVVNNLFSRYGIKSMDAVKATINDMSDKIWMVDNLVRSTIYLDAIAKAGVPAERMGGELTSRERAIAQKAIESVDREGYPDYDIPAVGKMGRLGAHMKNSPLWLFTRFHWNTVKLVKNDTVDALKTLNPKQWATTEGRKDIYRAADKVAAYALMAGVVYPMMDMVYQKLTGLDEEGVEARRGGAFGLAHAVAGLGSGEQRALGKFMNHMFTPSLPFSVGMDLYNSATNPMSGEKIVQLAKLRKAGEDAGEGDLTGAAGGLGSFAMDPAEYALFRAFAPAGTVRQGMRDYKGGGQKDASEKARAVVAAMLMGKLKNPQAEMRTEQNYHRYLKKIAKEQNKD